jgi:hypothetical protein
VIAGDFRRSRFGLVVHLADREKQRARVGEIWQNFDGSRCRVAGLLVGQIREFLPSVADVV